MRALRVSIPLFLLTLVAALPASASASTTIGQLLAPYEAGVCAATVLQDAVESGTQSYAVPAGGGVITSWQTRTGGNPGSVTLKVFRFAGTPGHYQVIGEEGPHTISANTSPSFSTGVRIPVQAGDLIGFYGAGTNCESYQPGKTGYHLFGFGIGVNVPVGTTATAEGGTTAMVAEIAAQVEPDADHDGYGDETQDACPADAGAHVLPCPVSTSTPTPTPLPIDVEPPVLKLSSKAKQAALKNKAVIAAATSTNEAASFKATGSVSVPGAGAFSLAPTAASGAAGVKVNLPLRIPKVALAKIKAALSQGKKVRANLHVIASDAAGNKSNAGQSVTIVSALRKR